MNSIKINNIELLSKVNGVGLRTVIWVQGCNLRCDGCFNPEIWNSAGGSDLDPFVFASMLPEEIEGITVSGGEPFQQSNLLYFLKEVKELKPELSIIVLTGYSKDELDMTEIIDFGCIDVLIAGRYDKNLHVGNELRGSLNKEHIFLSDRYSIKDFSFPKIEIKLINGELKFSGMIDSKIIMKKLEDYGIHQV